MEQVVPKGSSPSLLGTVLRVWREEGWPGLVRRLQARLWWLDLRPAAPRLPPLHRPDWLTIGASRESFAGEIALPAAKEPLVSVLLHDPGPVEDILCRLAAIGRHQPEASLEVIVVDDASHNDSPRLLSLVENLVSVRNEVRKGFARSMNEAARTARGRFLFFIDHGVQVQRGWLDELVAAFDDSKVGMEWPVRR